MAFASDLKTILQMAIGAGRGRNHAERLENFYSRQASTYDAFRQRLLHGRRDLYLRLPTPKDGIWIDMGGGTAANLEVLGARLQQLKQVYVVDLCSSLLQVARRRISVNGWSNVTAVNADVTAFRPPGKKADIVTFSYALTMIPDWSRALDHAYALLAPGGSLGVVDFYTSPAQWDLPLPCPSSAQRWFWPRWFAHDRVFLNPEHPAMLHRLFQATHMAGYRERVPYLPGLKVPYYQFIGYKALGKASHSAHHSPGALANEI